MLQRRSSYQYFQSPPAALPRPFPNSACEEEPAIFEKIPSTPTDAPCRILTMYPGPKPPTPHVPGIYRYTATALGAGMWFFLMYRAKKDGPVLLGWKHPWDH
ncbi:NADH dehydrogenase [ubiquinone] 1 beta subcomplex subunit 2 [Colletotrichum fructicola]|nr:NADH dehydrogenase [ubiquinone] 1 beta subcomplex subunit 2 [Colletotrichum fructicola]